MEDLGLTPGDPSKGPIPTTNAVKVLKMLRDQYRMARSINRITDARTILDYQVPND